MVSCRCTRPCGGLPGELPRTRRRRSRCEAHTRGCRQIWPRGVEALRHPLRCVCALSRKPVERRWAVQR
eukprot:2208409-Heterocapsa_arctica.AAC.1